ncbi:MAG: DUF732 domain-containing protein [Actinobacteria bacterium]|nr:DUF732 domain-containing protein [Actinomycetota bacterium]
MRGMFVCSALAAGAALATVLAAPAQADEIDDIFISVLDDEGIPYTSPGDAITVANAVCDYLADGNSLEDATVEVMNESGLGITDSGFFVGASTAAYCSEYSP